MSQTHYCTSQVSNTLPISKQCHVYPAREKSHEAPFAFIALRTGYLTAAPCGATGVAAAAGCPPALVAPLSPLTGSASQKITMDKGPLWPQLWAVRVSNFYPTWQRLKEKSRPQNFRSFPIPASARTQGQGGLPEPPPAVVGRRHDDTRDKFLVCSKTTSVAFLFQFFHKNKLH